MSFTKAHLYLLLKAYMANTITEEQLALLKAYVSETSSNSDLDAVINELWADMDANEAPLVASDALYQKIIDDPRVSLDLLNTPSSGAQATRTLWWKWAIGIAAVCCIAAFSLFLHDQWSNQDHEKRMGELQDTAGIIQPGGNKAMLTLADGRTISLDQINSGPVAEEGGIQIVKTADGEIFYEAVDHRKTDVIAYNTISTPKGGEYHLILPDGTKVWLNAASSLRYPTRFTGSTREVNLTGEAYFEVNKRPMGGGAFIVKSAKQTVEVLGTYFNITAYEDEESKTTLLKGLVKVSATIDPKANKMKLPATILQPGQQSSLAAGSAKIQVTAVDPLDALAWKNGYFIFHDENIKSVMTTIARWYDIEVDYEGDMSNKAFGGTISKFESFEKLLNTIELTESIKFKIVGRRVTVMT